MTDNLSAFVFLLLSSIITPEGQEEVTAISTHNTALACNQTMISQMRADTTLGCYRYKRDGNNKLVQDDPKLSGNPVTRVTGYDNSFRPDQIILKIERIN